MINTRTRGSCQQSKDIFNEFQGSDSDSELTEGFLAAEAILLFSALWVTTQWSFCFNAHVNLSQIITT